MSDANRQTPPPEFIAARAKLRAMAADAIERGYVPDWILEKVLESADSYDREHALTDPADRSRPN